MPFVHKEVSPFGQMTSMQAVSRVKHSVNLSSVEETMGISSAIREEAIETTPGNMTYQNRTPSVQVPESVFQELGQAVDQQKLSYAVFLRDTLFQSSDQNQSNLTVGSVIVAVTVNGTSMSRNLSTPITVTFQASEVSGRVILIATLNIVGYRDS